MAGWTGWGVHCSDVAQPPAQDADIEEAMRSEGARPRRWRSERETADWPRPWPRRDSGAERGSAPEVGEAHRLLVGPGAGTASAAVVRVPTCGAVRYLCFRCADPRPEPPPQLPVVQGVGPPAVVAPAGAVGVARQGAVLIPPARGSNRRRRPCRRDTFRTWGLGDHGRRDCRRRLRRFAMSLVDLVSRQSLAAVRQWCRLPIRTYRLGQTRCTYPWAQKLNHDDFRFFVRTWTTVDQGR